MAAPSILDLFWIFVVLATVQPLLKQKLMESATFP